MNTELRIRVAQNGYIIDYNYHHKPDPKSPGHNRTKVYVAADDDNLHRIVQELVLLNRAETAGTDQSTQKVGP